MRELTKPPVDREWARPTPAPSNRQRRGGDAAEISTPGTRNSETQPAVGRRLSDFLLAEGLITAEQLALALADMKRTNERLSSAIVRLGFLTDDQMVGAQSSHYRIPAVKFPDAEIPPEVVRLVPAAIARKYEVMPIGRAAAGVTLAMVDPTDLSAVDDVAFRTGMRVFPVICRPASIRQAIEQYYESPRSFLAAALNDAEAQSATKDTPELTPVDLRASADQVPVVRLVTMILLDAIQRGASDIHLEPAEHAFHVRFRIDGMLQDMMAPHKRLEPAVVSRIKIMASLDIAERRLPQDGRIKFRDASREIDFRVSVIPALFGESVVLRLLDRTALTTDLPQLGFDPWSLEQFQKAIKSPHGLILVTGPTGSGKTTTLYSALQTVNSPDIHVLTLEDPVEYNLPRVNQVQVNDEIGLTFASALRSFLRHDPDVILVGEMRDLDTAQIANRAALTGHLVLSTLHTNDAPSAVARLLDMGLPQFLLASSLRLVVAQRLVRKICDDCRTTYHASEDSLVPHGWTPQGLGTLTLGRGKGCASCSLTGLKGRIALYEVMPVTPELRELIVRGAATGELCKVARDQGMRTLREAGLHNVIKGITTVEEVLRVTTE